MLKHDIFSDALHCIQLLCVPVLHQKYFSEGSFSNDINHLEVLELHLNLSGAALENNL
jgi:hypothetical protein